MFRIIPRLLDDELVALRKKGRFPRKFFDWKSWRGVAEEKAATMKNAEKAEVVAGMVSGVVGESPLPPSSHFFQLANFSPERVNELAPYFSSADLLTARPVDFLRVHGLTLKEGRRVVLEVNAWKRGQSNGVSKTRREMDKENGVERPKGWKEKVLRDARRVIKGSTVEKTEAELAVEPVKRKPYPRGRNLNDGKVTESRMRKRMQSLGLDLLQVPDRKVDMIQAANEVVGVPDLGNNETTSTTHLTDSHLLHLADQFDASFGDPWLYISALTGLPSAELQIRYLKLTTPTRPCEFALTKSMKPMLMNRKFKLLPPKVVIVPSRRASDVKGKDWLKPSFKGYRDPRVFQDVLS